MNQELGIRLTSIEELQQDEKLAKFIRFIKNNLNFNALLEALSNLVLVHKDT